MVTDLWCHLPYNLEGAWHTVYAMLLSNYKCSVSIRPSHISVGLYNQLLPKPQIKTLHTYYPKVLKYWDT